MKYSPISIVIPNYNGEDLLPRSLPKIYDAVEQYPGRVEVIVVDDASQDGSVLLLKEKFPGIRIVCHDVNKGFSEAVYTGIMHALNEIIILLNTDVYPDKNFINPLVKWFDLKDTFSVSPLVYNTDGIISGVSWNICKIERGTIRYVRMSVGDISKAQSKGKPLISMFSSGGSMALRKSMFMELNGFLSLYKPFYHEDADLCLRAWEKGWKTYCEPSSSVIHDHHSTINRYFSYLRIKTISKRNKFIYLWLHLSKRKIFFSHIPWLLPRFIGRIIRLDIPFIAGFIFALASLGEIYKIRSSINNNELNFWLDDLSTILLREMKELCK